MTRIAIEQVKIEIYAKVYEIFCKAIKDMGVELEAINLDDFRNQIEREVRNTLRDFSVKVDIR